MVAISGAFLLGENGRLFPLGPWAKGHSPVLPHLLEISEPRPHEGKGIGFVRMDPIPGENGK